jgi:hypothetical protein
LQTGHKFGSRRPNWDLPSATWVRQVEQLIELDRKVEKALKGERPPANAVERLEFAQFCQGYKKLYATAAAWYIEAFAMDPMVVKDLDFNRVNAASAAALAGTGRGRDAGKLKEDELARLRKQALDWLRADLALHAKLLQGDQPQDRALVQEQLKNWQSDGDLACIRDSGALDKLPAGERAAFVQFWADVETMLRKAREQK